MWSDFHDRASYVADDNDDAPVLRCVKDEEQALPFALDNQHAHYFDFESMGKSLCVSKPVMKVPGKRKPADDESLHHELVMFSVLPGRPSNDPLTVWFLEVLHRLQNSPTVPYGHVRFHATDFCCDYF